MPLEPSAHRPVVIFDFDGTIADSMQVAIQEYNRLAPKFRVKPIDIADLARLRALKASAALSEHNVSFWKLPLLVSAMRSAMRARVDSVQPIEGITGALRELHASGLRCSVLSTNSGTTIESFLGRHDLRVFEHIVGDVSMFGKASALRRLIKRAGLAPEQVVYVGDEVRDVEAAHAAGVRPLAVSWGYSGREALAAHNPWRLIERADSLVSAL